MPRQKLQIRIIILISGLSVLFISAFAYIQLRHQVQNIETYNSERANNSSLFMKMLFELLFKDVETEEALPVMFQGAITAYEDMGYIEKASILTTDGKAIATNDPLVREYGESKESLKTYKRLAQTKRGNTWMYSAVNQKTKSQEFFIPIKIGQTSYIAKLSYSVAKNYKQAVDEMIIPVGLTALAVIAGNLLLGYVLLSTVVHPIKQLNKATKDIASGHLDRRVNIRTRDEIEELGHTFNKMAVALKKMKEVAENANPLTGLPGNNIIREEIENRIKKNDEFVAVHLDLDHFKAYNDRYGVGKGDDVIKFTSSIIADAVKNKGNKNDFVGHEGGDDFFLLTTPDKAEAVGDYIIKEFDSKIRTFYTKNDQEIGYIPAKDRQGNLTKFPIMTISLAGVTNKFRPIKNYGELTNIAVGVKEKAKAIKQSNFFLDQRKF